MRSLIFIIYRDFQVPLFLFLLCCCLVFISFHLHFSFSCLLFFCCNDNGRVDEGFAGTAPGPGMGHLMQRFAGGEIFAGTC